MIRKEFSASSMCGNQQPSRRRKWGLLGAHRRQSQGRQGTRGRAVGHSDVPHGAGGKTSLQDYTRSLRTNHQSALFFHFHVRNPEGIKSGDTVLQNRTWPRCRDIFKHLTCMRPVFCLPSQTCFSLPPTPASAVCSGLCTRPRLCPRSPPLPRSL